MPKAASGGLCVLRWVQGAKQPRSARSRDFGEVAGLAFDKAVRQPGEGRAFDLIDRHAEFVRRADANVRQTLREAAHQMRIAGAAAADEKHRGLRSVPFEIACHGLDGECG